MADDDKNSVERKEFFEIPPKDGTGQYVDQFWSGMFGNLGAFAQAEQRLIWMRYSAFLVVQSFIFAFTKDLVSDPSANAVALFFTGILGLVVCSVWAFLNYCGWRHQNKLFWYASRLKFKVHDLELPTDMFRRQAPPEPFGPIYWSAQLMPIAFGVISCLCTYPLIAKVDLSRDIAHWGIVALLGGVFVALVKFACGSVRRQDAV